MTINDPNFRGYFEADDSALQSQRNRISNDAKKARDPWNPLYKKIEEHDNEMCKAWSEEIQNLLVFASLFAATVTAFAIESHKWLESDPAETTAKMMTQISLQLANLSNPLEYNSALSASLSFDPEPRRSCAVVVNILWFLSLSISLSTVLIGILCLQWIREYQKDPHHLSAQDAVLLRQLRYVGIIGWKVPQIISTLPVLLQLAVLLFFLGLCYFLYELDRIVAVVIMPMICSVPLILFGTALAPIVQRILNNKPTLPSVQCPYKSPQAWLCYLMVRPSRRWLSRILVLFTTWTGYGLSFLEAFTRIGESANFRSWIQWDEQWRKNVGHATYIESVILWIRDTWGHRSDVFEAVPNILERLDTPELHIEMILLLYQQWSPWFNDSFQTNMFNQILERLTHAPKALATLPSKSHVKLLEILKNYDLHYTGHTLDDASFKALAKFFYWSWTHLDPGATTSYHLEELLSQTKHVIACTERLDFVVARGSRQLEGTSRDEGYELNISGIEIHLMVLGLSDTFPLRIPISRFPEFPDVIIKHVKSLCQDVLPVLQLWKGRANREHGGWAWLVALTAGIQLALTRLGMVEAIGNDHPHWKEFYGMVIEKPYGPWEEDLPPSPLLEVVV
ncbi:hypothetical protein AX16_005296 [Volvariella volvacea WC 439]|nr:hypothetical protein AX16_005296 [Volvariella volvacea WC 439]